MTAVYLVKRGNAYYARVGYPLAWTRSQRDALRIVRHGAEQIANRVRGRIVRLVPRKAGP